MAARTPIESEPTVIRMADRFAAHDWSTTPLGPRECWPEALNVAVDIVMNSRFPMFIWWGPQLINIYNDPYIPMLGKKHPAGFGRPAAEVWYEIWDIVGKQAELVIHHRQSTWNEEMLLVMERHGYTEETYFTWSYSPIGTENGLAQGVFCAVTEDTPKVIGRRRLKTLRELAMETSDLRTAPQAFSAAARVIGRNPFDIPFALLYEMTPDRKNAKLAESVGLAGAPPCIVLDLCSEEVRAISDLKKYFDLVPQGPWPDLPTEALILPFAKRGESEAAGFMVAGISRYIKLDEDYRGFLGLVAGHIATALANSRAYEAERRRAEALAEIDRAKTTFFSNVSHEFRTPLTLMLAPLEDLREEVAALDPENRDRVETAHRNALRLLKLVNTLLDFARIEAGRVQAYYQTTDLAALTRDVASVFRAAVERAGLKFVIDVAEIVEPVYVDCEMWEKILLNLLSNAFKFTLDGEIRVSLSTVDSAVRLTVSDTGIGIPADELPRLFERFHRVRGARGRSIEGSGIGLALIQELAKLHGGTVTVESEVDRGSKFHVTIPLGKAHLPADRIGFVREQRSTAARAEAFVEEALRMLPESRNSISSAAIEEETILPVHAPGSRARIVLADDNADMRNYACRLLSREYDVTAVADGVEALAAIFHKLPDLVLTDVMMPNLDGFGLVRVLRADARTRDLPVILLTARAGEEERIEGMETGADEYLTKPFSSRELLARVQAALKLRRVREENNRALRESEHRYRTLFNSMEEGFCTVEILFGANQDAIDFRFLDVNPAFEKQSGLKNAKGRWIREVAPDLEEYWYEIYGRIARTGETMRFENEAKGRWFEVCAFRIDSAELHRVAVIFTDITERRRREEQLRQANKDLEQFAYSASHDLQEPIRSVSIYSELLAKTCQGRLNDQELQFLEFVRSGAERMGLLVQDLLAYTRVVNLDAAAENTDCNEALESALSNLDGAIRASGAEIVREPLPAIAAQPMHLQQLFQNLIGNAIKYRSPDRPAVIRVSAQRGNEEWVFSIADNGIGIEPEYRDAVFGLFKRLHGGEKYSGTGIGLAICQRIVERYGGRIWVDSDLGVGSTFRFAIPG